MNSQAKRQSNYGIAEIIENIWYVIKTKLLFSTSRLVRFPITIRGRKYIDFGKLLTTGRRCRIEVNGVFNKRVLYFGENVNIGDDVRISAAESISIGNNVLIGSKVLIIDNSHGSYKGDSQDSPDTPPNERTLFTSPIVIEDNVWIGEGAVIQMGVTLGYGCIIAANSVVTKSVQPRSMVGGVPARILKEYDDNTGCWKQIM